MYVNIEMSRRWLSKLNDNFTETSEDCMFNCRFICKLDNANYHCNQSQCPLLYRRIKSLPKSLVRIVFE